VAAVLAQKYRWEFCALASFRRNDARSHDGLLPAPAPRCINSPKLAPFCAASFVNNARISGAAELVGVQYSDFCTNMWDPFRTPKPKPVGTQRLANWCSHTRRAKLAIPREIRAFCTGRAKTSRKTHDYSRAGPIHGKNGPCPTARRCGKMMDSRIRTSRKSGCA
jgi:hypothetical protein